VPRPRKDSSGGSSLSPGQASYVLDRMIAERRISLGEVNRYISEIHREISDLEARLSSLRSASGASAAAPSRGPGRPRGRRPGRPPGRPGRPPGRPPAAASAPAAAPAAPRRGRPPGGGVKRGRKRGGAALSPEQLASRQLQGRYLGLIRQIPASRRGQYQKTAKERGREAAIKEMQSALGK